MKKIRKTTTTILPGILELRGGLLLDAKDDDIGAADTDNGVAFADGLEGLLDLEKVAIGGEDGDGPVVPRHPPKQSPFFFFVVRSPSKRTLRSSVGEGNETKQ